LAIPAGTRLGAYEIESVLGTGGMGEVYRARDTRLGRTVALKVILEPFASDPERVARFEREAKVLASLNHPHIAALYGMEQAGARHFLVMELVEGETLADRLRRGALPIEDTIAIARQIAEALEAAHEKSIVHRDLKPANVKIAPDDTVKVLDFGLAKAIETDSTAASVANSPTLSMMASQKGVILGTAAYMSPEQAKGLPADHRSDIFAFGVVLYEMATGRQPFHGETAPDILASVLAREPDLAKLPGDVNPRFVDLVRRCLEKPPKRRWQAIGDVRAELEAIALAPRCAPAAARAGPLWRRALPAVMAAIIFGAIGAAAAWHFKPPPSVHVARFSFAFPADQQVGAAGVPLAVAPDGSQFAYVADQRINVRRISDDAVSPVRGSEATRGLASPAFSPDSRSIVFYSIEDERLKRIAAGGGVAVPLCRARNVSGISWGAGGVLFAQSDDEDAKRGIFECSPGGGEEQQKISIGKNESANHPQILPDGKTVLFSVATGLVADRWANAKVVAQSIDGGPRTILVDGSEPQYLPSGYLVYLVKGTVYAARFNPRTLEVGAERVPVLEDVWHLGRNGGARFAVSDSGLMIYMAARAAGGRLPVALAIVDRQGAVTPINVPAGRFSTPRASPDGSRVAFGSDDGKDAFVAVYDLSGTSVVRHVTYSGRSRFPVWAPDSKRIAFQSNRESDEGIWVQASDGTGPAVRLTKPRPGESHVPQSWSSDGATLLFEVATDAGISLSTLSLKDGTIARFDSVVSELPTGAVFSPNGKWIAYTATLQRETHFWVQPFPATTAKYQLNETAQQLAHHPTWSRDGTWLNYLEADDRFESVPVTTQAGFGFGNPIELKRPFRGPRVLGRRGYDMLPDGRLVAMMASGEEPSAPLAPPVIEVVLNWLEELKARVPH
jgi:serine/threonine-protein kinase